MYQRFAKRSSLGAGSRHGHALRADRRRRIAGSSSYTASQKRTRSVEPLENRMLLTGGLVIAEFMASNDTGINDEDAQTSDWIELLNVSNEQVQLGGWHLTDDQDELTKWTFPEKVLQAGESTVVFASGKDRTGSELHTNFRLSQGGEYLALVQPDGEVADSYSPYPEQYPDVSYGPQQETIVHSLVAPGAASKALTPASAGQDLPTTTWTAVGFQDSSWTDIAGPAGYDTDQSDGDFGTITGGGDLSSMNGNTSSTYIRTSFNIEGDTVPDLNTMAFDAHYDDGFVAYLNGGEILRVNAPASLAWDATASDEHGGVLEKRVYTNFVDDADQDEFMLQGDANWFFGRLQLTTGEDDQTGAAWTRDAIPFGADYSFSTHFQIDVFGSSRGSEGMAFVLQSGGNSRLGLGGSSLGLESTGMTFVAVEFDTQAGGLYDDGADFANHVGIDTSVDGNIARTEIDRWAGSAAFGGVHDVWIEYNGLTDQMDVYFSETTDKPETPTVSATVDLQTLFEASPDLWAGWTAATSSSRPNSHVVTEWQFTSGAGQLGLEPVRFDVSQHTALLQPGENVLAIHGLNLDASDEDFVIGASLTATETILTEPKYFSPSTPYEPNGLGGLPPAGGVSFDISTRVFTEPFTVEIAANHEGEQVRYTTDGSLPDESSELYTGPITIEQSTRLRARAFAPERDPGPVSSEGFVHLDSAVSEFENGEAFNSNLPIMIFDSYDEQVNRNQRNRLIPVTAIFIDPGADGRANVLDEPQFAGRAGMRIRGQSSEGWPKRQYALEIWDEGNSDAEPIDASEAEDKAISFFGMPSESDWVLNAPYSDKTQLNNYLTFKWSNEMGLYAPRARLVEVFVNETTRNETDGSVDFTTDYRGTYVLLEKIKIDKNRVDITSLSPRDNAEPDITGGYIWKKDKSGLNDVIFTTDQRQQLRMVEPSTDITDEQKFWLNNHINEFEAALYGPDFKDPEVGYAKYINPDSWIDTWILVEMTKQIDGFRLSTYYYKDRGGKIEQGPPWDYNLSLGNANYLRGGFPDGWYGETINAEQYPYWERLFEDPNFSQKLTDRWQELRSTIFTTDKMLADIDAAVDLISDGNPNLDRPAEGELSNPISRNFTKWRSTINTYLWPNCYFGVDVCPAESPLESPENPSGRPRTYGDYIFLMKNFVEQRFAWMDDQFISQPTPSLASGIVQPGVELELSADMGQIIYSTDGSDPRGALPGAEEDTWLASGGQVDYLVPFILDSFTEQIVQACDGSPLAAPSECLMSPDYTLGTHGETWHSATMPVGFDDKDNFTAFIETDISTNMDNTGTTAYIRIPFELTAEQLASAATLSLQMRYDDGFIAYLWSDQENSPVEIARANAEGDPQTIPITPLPATSKASRSHSNRLAVNYEEFDITGALPYLREGTNYLTLHAMNQSLTSHDFLMDALIVAKKKLELPEGLFQYDQPIPINANTQITARTYDAEADAWSGVLTATYLTDAPELVVSELNYNPTAPTTEEAAAGFDDGDDFEFLEIRNVSSQATNLVGTEFTNGIDFKFPSIELAPGERTVIVGNLAAFQQRYGNDIEVAGQYSGNLNNNGEQITIANGLGETISNFTYGDSSLWPQRADGFGATLQLIESLSTPADQLGKYYHWRGSTEPGGSPGSQGEAPRGIVVNEVLASTTAPNRTGDAIELYNASGADVDVSGWYLSDSGVDPLKYRLPAGTNIPAGGYLVFNESHFNADNAGDNGFALSRAQGDNVWLVIADESGRVQTFVDDVHFGSTSVGEALGRVPNGSGRLAPMSSVTLGAENASPRVGPVVLTEVNYNPGPPSEAALANHAGVTSADLEFIEVHNPTSESFNLNGWRIRGGIDYDFSGTQTLDPNASIVLTRFDADDPDNEDLLNAFRAHYGLSDSISIQGPYQGLLNNIGERVQLQRPDPSSQVGSGFAIHLQEDEVVYDDLLPWPVDADGQGKSLTRTSAQAWGNDPASWLASDPTPGSLTEFVPQAGDANMDGEFDQGDIVLLLQANKYNTGQPATFAEGDFTGDGVFNQLDIVAALQTGNYLQGPYASLSKSQAVHDHAVDEVLAEEDSVEELFWV